MVKIAIVTAVKDEFANIPKLIEAMEKQTIEIYSWVIIENDSTDGSAEYLRDVKKVNNVKHLCVLNLSFSSKMYDIGFKYSKIVQHGFEYIKTREYFNNLDYIGILDADCFPENDYFRKLVDNMQKNPDMGITSGVLYFSNGKREPVNIDHIRGTGRLWSKSCFEVSGDFYGLSPDTITREKAIICGWKPQVTYDAVFISRKANSRGNLEFRGKSAYYNGYTISYIIIKSIYYTYKSPEQILPLIKGYFSSYIKNEPKNYDNEILQYNRKYLYRVIMKRYSILKDRFISIHKN